MMNDMHVMHVELERTAKRSSVIAPEIRSMMTRLEEDRRQVVEQARRTVPAPVQPASPVADAPKDNNDDILDVLRQLVMGQEDHIRALVAQTRLLEDIKVNV